MADTNIRYENAIIIVTEIARLAAIDSNLADEERSLITEILDLLNFDSRAAAKMFAWMDKLVEANLKEEELQVELRTYYKE